MLTALAALAAAGCQTRTLPNPNDPKDVAEFSVEILRRNLRAVTDSLSDRYAKGELDEKAYKRLVTKAADELLQGVDPSKVSADEAWQYGEVLRDAHHWADAEKVLRMAVKFATTTKNEDRRVNDTLRLAHVIAAQGRIDEAIRTARQAFDASPAGSAPILLAVYLEIAPAGRGKGQDAELAKLVEDAIPIHLRTRVDSSTDAGRMFLAARSFHVRSAWQLAEELYRSGGREDLAREAQRKAMEMRPAARQVVGI